MRVGLVLVLVLVGCAAKRPVLEGPAPASMDEPAGPVQVEQRAPVTGPVEWWDGSGLCLDVPEGWTGLGLGDQGRLLSISHQETSVSLEILSGDAPADREGLVLAFSDQGTTRDVPALVESGVESWISDLPGGDSLQVWHVSADEETFRFEARYPFGRMIVGGPLIESLLAEICFE